MHNPCLCKTLAGVFIALLAVNRLLWVVAMVFWVIAFGQAQPHAS